MFKMTFSKTVESDDYAFVHFELLNFLALDEILYFLVNATVFLQWLRALRDLKTFHLNRFILNVNTFLKQISCC